MIWILVILGVGFPVAAILILVVSLRVKWEPGVRFVRRLGRDRFNRVQLRTAGTPGAGAQVIRTIGRKSGTPYRTPIGLQRILGGWLVTLPYGTSPDWLKNLRAAGSAEIEVEGQVHTVTDPRIVPRAEVEHHLGTGGRLIVRVFGIDDFLLLDDAPAVVS